LRLGPFTDLPVSELGLVKFGLFLPIPFAPGALKFSSCEVAIL